MKKENSLIIGSGVIGGYLAKLLITKKHKVIVTSRNIKKNYINYNKLNIEEKIVFEELDVLKKKDILRIIRKYNPENIFYFSGQSSLTKSINLKKETNDSNYVGAKNFLEILYRYKIKSKFYKANSGYIFEQKNGLINLNSEFSKNKNPYIQSQIKAYKEVKKFREKGVNSSSLIFLQVESPLRSNDFLVKKICEHAKSKKHISVGNLNTIRDYSWASEIVEGVYHLTKIKPRDLILSSGQGISGQEILKIAYKLNNLDYKKYFSINKKYIRPNEIKTMIGSNKNYTILSKKFNFKIKIGGKKLVKKIYDSL
jgi:GDPmannose 4,6-dehydratase|tara:strand:+ start:73 stop:1008 length:936 start_codon:yes stop_codon:yes gene_type:complete